MIHTVVVLATAMLGVRVRARVWMCVMCVWLDCCWKIDRLTLFFRNVCSRALCVCQVFHWIRCGREKSITIGRYRFQSVSNQNRKWNFMSKMVVVRCMGMEMLREFSGIPLELSSFVSTTMVAQCVGLSAWLFLFFFSSSFSRLALFCSFPYNTKIVICLNLHETRLIFGHFAAGFFFSLAVRIPPSVCSFPCVVCVATFRDTLALVVFFYCRSFMPFWSSKIRSHLNCFVGISLLRRFPQENLDIFSVRS